MFSWGAKSEEKNEAAFIAKVNNLKLKEQLEKQVEILQKVGLLEILSDGKTLGIWGVDNKDYKIPTFEEIQRRMVAKKDLLKNKIEQGFTKIILVPFGCPVEKIITKYEESLVAHHNNGLILATKEKPEEKDEMLELDATHPLNIWNECRNGDIKNAFVYFPKAFVKDDHQGKTKIELLFVDPKNAWQIFLIENMPNIPSSGLGKKIGHRRQLEVGETPIKYLEILQKDKHYEGEEGLIPEADLIYSLYTLEEKNQILNDWQGKGNISCELGAFLVPSNSVPWLSWDRDFKRADLWKLTVETSDPHMGPRTGIRI